MRCMGGASTGENMFAITGITGQVGGQVAQALLASGCKVRAVLRDAAKAQVWATRGCDIALAAMDDMPALTAAFTGVEAAFVLLPPTFDPSPGFGETRRFVDVLFRALAAARPARVVCISTIGAQAAEENLLTQLQMLERGLGALPLPIAFLRPAWFMENTAWDIASAQETSSIASLLQPVDKPVPMVATRDVADVAARLLQEEWKGRRVVELEGQERVSPNDIAAALGLILGRDVQVQPVARSTWEALFRSQGMQNPGPRMRMLDGFNEGWIAFENGTASVTKGSTNLAKVLRELVDRART
jgi:uncharacterized protein YbjT (DUF2867 family)